LNPDGTNEVCIIGAGPAGLMAAVFAARQGADVCVMERNSSAGRKLLLTGGGRCNLTHAGGIDDFVSACSPYGNLLRPAFYTLSPEDLLTFFHDRGLQTQVEPNGSIFPLNKTASGIRDVLLNEIKSSGISIVYSDRIVSVKKGGGVFSIQSQHHRILSSSVVIATGGASWPQTGSTGDGYEIAASFGHHVQSPVGILCPVVCDQSWPGGLQGISLAQVRVRVKMTSKASVISGAMVFTESGLGGPAAFDISRLAADAIRCGDTVPMTIDFCPQMAETELDTFLIHQFSENPNRETAAVLSTLLPRRLAECLTAMVFGEQIVTAGHLPKKSRHHIVQLVKQMPLTVTGCGGLEKATVTRGGVCCKEVDFKTMRSRLCPGLYFAGEVLDVDGPCGGYNLQIAFSTGALAGTKASQYAISKKSPDHV
jgi:predicted Rossmann fold flavoprotein